MNVAHPKLVPATSEPRTHNHLIGNLPALQEAMDRDGYWFFRDVLDKDAVARLRRIYTDELENVGAIDPVGDASTEGSVHAPPVSTRSRAPSMAALHQPVWRAAGLLARAVIMTCAVCDGLAPTYPLRRFA